MDTAYYLREAKSCSIDIDEDDVSESAVGGIRAIRSRVASAEDEDSAELPDLLKAGKAIPLEFLHLETPGDRPKTGFYVVELQNGSERRATIAFRNIESGETLDYRLAFDHEGGVSASGASAHDPDFNDFAFANYVNWCGRWRGRRRRWRVCTGEDCGSGHGICIQRRF